MADRPHWVQTDWGRGVVRAAVLGLILGIAAVVFVAATVHAQTGRAETPVLRDIRVHAHPDRTRRVAELSARVEFGLSLFQDPDRLVIDFPALDWHAAPPDRLAGAGLIQAVDRVPDADGVTRITLDLTGPAQVRDAFFLGQTASVPYRFVRDLQPLAAAPPGTAAAGPGTEPASDGRDARRPIIVIDPGHGGFDPGAVGAAGTLESAITLAVSLRLREMLVGDGRYDVVMTRSTEEEYVALRERVRRGRAAGADLFMSIHADANPSRAVRGASIYTLSGRASDREAAMLAARENRQDALTEIEIDPNDAVMASILIDLAQRETHTESNAIAEFLVNRMGAVKPLLVNTHREAGFAVLTAPDVPSVLVELGHLSNASDEALLNDPVHQTLLADALRQGVDDYFDWLDVVNGS